MSYELEVSHRGGDRFEIAVRDHVMVVDQPCADGGEDSGPTPTELLVASLASCVAHYAHRYLVRHDLAGEGLRVSAAFDFATGPVRVGEVRLEITLPESLPEERLPGLLAVASRCTVHNTLEHPPTVRIEVAEPLAARG